MAIAAGLAGLSPRNGRRWRNSPDLRNPLASAILTFGLAACASTDVVEISDPNPALVAPEPVVASTPKADESAPVESAQKAVASAPKIVAQAKPVRRGGGYQKLGKPYRIAGKLYVPQRDPDYDQVGVASWYGRQFHGRLTANGERFDMNAIMAAHPTMPLPSYARVTNMANGRSIIVRINDRGPFAHNRVIDLSRKTASVLDFKSKGTAKVRVQFVGDAPLDAKDEAYLVASYNGPGPGPRQNRSGPIVTAFAAPPAPRPQTDFPAELSADRLDRSAVESGTRFDPYLDMNAAKAAAQKADGVAAEKSSYAATTRVSIAFNAIENLTR